MVHKFFGAFDRRAGAVVGRRERKKTVARLSMAQGVVVGLGATKEHVDLNLISAAIHHGCMGLPQELVDNIMDMLHDDLQALSACSLACKAMFASTRRLIHQTLHLPRQNDERVLIREGAGKPRNWGGGHSKDVELSFMSYLRKYDLLRYTRQVHIHNSCTFTPDTLQPHLHSFQSLDRVHALTIDHYNADAWSTYYKSYFLHFYPALTSLTLRHPSGQYRLILRFALQFPNLENLCLECPQRDLSILPGAIIPTTTDRFPALRGNLQLAGLNGAVWRMMDFACRNGTNFRSIELEDAFDDHRHAQRILNACAGALENLTITPHGIGYLELRYLTFREITGLRRLTLRTAFTPVSGLAFGFLPVSTITSPVFREFVLELGGRSSRFDGPSPAYWGRWEEVDRLVEQRFAKDGDFRLVIRTGELRDREAFQRHVKQNFPLLASRGCIHFETTYG